VILVVLFAPLWPDFVEGRFLLEPSRRAVIRAEVAGVVDRVMVSENQSVTPGSPLLRLHNLQLESEAAQANAKFREVSARAIDAGMRYADFGPAERERQETAERNNAIAGRLARLQLTSPIAGVVVTPRLEDLLGTYVEPGTAIAEVADLSTMTARIYIPEFGVRDVRVGTRVRLHAESRATPISGTLASIEPLSSEIDPALTETAKLSGIVHPPFYVGYVSLQNDGTLREGMSGTAKLFVRRRSPAEMMARFARDLVERRFW
jgi:multidrug resistance efflux pump